MSRVGHLRAVLGAHGGQAVQRAANERGLLAVAPAAQQLVAHRAVERPLAGHAGERSRAAVVALGHRLADVPQQGRLAGVGHGDQRCACRDADVAAVGAREAPLAAVDPHTALQQLPRALLLLGDVGGVREVQRRCVRAARASRSPAACTARG
jgi:hypothetical protein